jgi:hypothetical protein
VDGYYLLEYGQKGERETLYEILKDMKNHSAPGRENPGIEEKRS